MEYCEVDRRRDEEHDSHRNRRDSPPHRYERHERRRSRSPRSSDGRRLGRNAAEDSVVRGDRKSLDHRGGSEIAKQRGTQPPAHTSEISHDSKIAAVEKAKEMALRTREIISKLGGLKQLAVLPECSLPQSTEVTATVLESKKSPAKTVSGKTGSADPNAAISKILQNESLVKYAFTIPIGDDKAESYDSHTKVNTLEKSPIDRETSSVLQDSPPRAHTAHEMVENDQLFDYSRGIPLSNRGDKMTTSWFGSFDETKSTVLPSSVTSVASDQWKGTNAEEVGSANCDPTIANILKSIGFNFDLSSLMQEKAKREREAASFSTVDLGTTISPGSVTARSASQTIPEVSSSRFSLSNLPKQTYEEIANQYKVERQKQIGLSGPPVELVSTSAPVPVSSLQQLQKSYEPYEPKASEDIFRDSSPEMKLKFKAVDVKGSKKNGALYEDFSDSDESFADTACSNPAYSDVLPTKAPAAPAFTVENESLTSARASQGAVKLAAEEHDWVQSTEDFIRKLQQPRQEAVKKSTRHVTIIPKKDPPKRGTSTPRDEAVHEPQQKSPVPIPKDHIKLMETVMPIEELKNIKKTFVVSEKNVGGVTKDSTSERSDLTDGVTKGSRLSDGINRDDTAKKNTKSEKCDQEADRNRDSKEKTDGNRKSISEDDHPKGSSKLCSQPKADSEISSDLKFPGVSEAERLERQQKIDALVRELEGLRRQQSALWRRKKREKDGHKDPILIENSKLQEEISKQIVLLKQASKQVVVKKAEETSSNKSTKQKVLDGMQYMYIIIFCL